MNTYEHKYGAFLKGALAAGGCDGVGFLMEALTALALPMI
jgi:hypothetical protein